jgi:predicted acetyltransferase
MQLEVIRADLPLQTTFRNLFQFYLYEFSGLMGWPVTLGGRFIEDDLDGCWAGGRRLPYLFRREGEWVGLAIVDRNPVSRYTGDPNVTCMAEFFVMAAYRKRGFGREAVIRLFDQYTGQWEVFQHNLNPGAAAFWQRVIGDYTGGQFRQIPMLKYNGIVRVFGVQG